MRWGWGVDGMVSYEKWVVKEKGQLRMMRGGGQGGGDGKVSNEERSSRERKLIKLLMRRGGVGEGRGKGIL